MRRALAFIAAVILTTAGAPVAADLPHAPASTALHHNLLSGVPLPGRSNQCDRDATRLYVGCWLLLHPQTDNLTFFNIRADGTFLVGEIHGDRVTYGESTWQDTFTLSQGSVIRLGALYSYPPQVMTSHDIMILRFQDPDSAALNRLFGVLPVIDISFFVRFDQYVRVDGDKTIELPNSGAIARFTGNAISLSGLVNASYNCAASQRCSPGVEYSISRLSTLYAEWLAFLYGGDEQETQPPNVAGSQSATPTGPPDDPEEAPARVQSRINITSDGIHHVRERHYDAARANLSQFIVPEYELRAILQSPRVINTPVQRIPSSGNYARQVQLGGPIGRIAQTRGGSLTNRLTVITDKFGNLKSAFPGSL